MYFLRSSSMPAPKRTTRIAQTFLSNAPSSTPLVTEQFRHTLSHATQNLAQLIERTNKFAFYDLKNLSPETPALSEQALSNATSSALQTLIQTSRSQFCSRESTLERRRIYLQAKSNQAALKEFCVHETLLPPSNTIEPRDECCEKPDLNNSYADKLQEQAVCKHEDAAGIVIDLDEAAHGAFASSKYLKEAAHGRPEAVAASFKEKSAEVTQNPIASVGKELAESGVTEFATAVSAAGVMLPLAALAVKAGFEEWQHGKHELRKRITIKDIQTNTLDKLTKLTDSSEASPNFRALKAAEFIRVEKSVEGIKQAVKIKQIGMMSAASGMSIGLKAISDIVLKISLGLKSVITGKGFFGLGEAARSGTAAAGATVGFGIAGTFVLGPLAGVFATALGGFFAMKSHQKHQQLKKDFQLLQSDLKDQSLLKADPTSVHFIALRDFLIRQGNKRIGFFKRFQRWNKAFMVGSGLYASSAVTKATVIGLASAGVLAAVSNPVILGVVTAAGIAGSLIMGVTSFSFLRGHGKQGKYSRHTAGDHPWVDRKLMTTLHGLANIPGGLKETHPGFDLAAETLDYLNTERDNARKFFNRAAEKTKKISPMKKNLSIWKHVLGNVMGTKQLRAFLSSKEGLSAIHDLARESLFAKNRLLERRLIHRLTMCVDLLRSIERTSIESLNTPEESLERIKFFTDVLAELDEGLSRDQSAIELNLLNLKKLGNDENPTPLAEIAILLGAGNSPEKIANHMIRDYQSNLRRARGVLFEAQLEAARLRERQFIEQMEFAR